MASAMIDEPPSNTKLELIRRFLAASGLQAEIDSGSFLDRFSAPGTPLFQALVRADAEIKYGDALALPVDALRQAYQRHRHVWQDEYVSHVNWEFSEPELEVIVVFLEGPAGAHLLEARWRMRAYIGTNTEHVVEEIVAEAAATLSSRDAGGE